MAPVAAANVETNTAAIHPTKGASSDASYPRAPLQLSGILDGYRYNEVTPVIGREYPTIQLKELIDAPNSDDLLRELAIVSEWLWATLGNAID